VYIRAVNRSPYLTLPYVTHVTILVDITEWYFAGVVVGCISFTTELLLADAVRVDDFADF
jgi:hypothetical protein